MKMEMYSVYDKKTVLYSKPFYAHNKGHAIRCLQEEVDKKDSQLNKYAGDFNLCRIGSFDDETGAVISHLPEVVIECSDLLNNKS